eukprot:3545088-Rhodomonas_salina.3
MQMSSIAQKQWHVGRTSKARLYRPRRTISFLIGAGIRTYQDITESVTALLYFRATCCGVWFSALIMSRRAPAAKSFRHISHPL